MRARFREGVRSLEARVGGGAESVVAKPRLLKGDDMVAIEAAREELDKQFSEAAEAMYKAAQSEPKTEPQPAASDETQGRKEGPEGAVDAEFTVEK